MGVQECVRRADGAELAVRRICGIQQVAAIHVDVVSQVALAGRGGRGHD